MELEYASQERFLAEKWSWLETVKTNTASPELIHEIQLFKPNCNDQLKPLCFNMCGSPITPSNFLIKVCSDFLLDFEKSKHYYKPTYNTHFINYLLGYKIYKDDNTNKNYWELKKCSNDAWRFIILCAQYHPDFEHICSGNFKTEFVKIISKIPKQEKHQTLLYKLIEKCLLHKNFTVHNLLNICKNPLLYVEKTNTHDSDFYVEHLDILSPIYKDEVLPENSKFIALKFIL